MDHLALVTIANSINFLPLDIPDKNAASFYKDLEQLKIEMKKIKAQVRIEQLLKLLQQKHNESETGRAYSYGSN